MNHQCLVRSARGLGRRVCRMTGGKPQSIGCFHPAQLARINSQFLQCACVGFAALLAGAAVSEEIEPRAAWTSSKLHGQPTAPAPYKIEPAFPRLRFEKPTCVTEIPGTDRLLVTEQGGKLISFRKEKDVASTLLVGDLSEVAGGGVSINHATFHPNFASNRFLFVALGHPAGGYHSRVARYTLTDSPNPKVLPDSERLIIKWPTGGHGGGCLQFGIDGFLYISTGDGTGPSPPDGLTTGQDVSDLLGAVLRIDVDSETADTNYTVPGDNPFVDMPNVRAEIWSYGLRNPWKFGIDRVTGDVFVADNGWETWEMIHKLHRGSNCGWPIMEGRARLRTEVKIGPTPITPPVKDHPHTEANSVIGGPVYRGEALADLRGMFVYGDYITGTIWALRAGHGSEFEHRTLVDTDLHIVAFTEGSKGEIFVLDYDRTGQLYQLQPNTEVDTSANFPRRLSETGLFASTTELIPTAGVIPYSVLAERWMDGADGQRWVAIPGRATITLDANSSSTEFPDGTVFVKQVTLPATAEQAAKRLETQLWHFENGSWNPYSYLWDDDGKDASLVEPEGTDYEFAITDAPQMWRTWHVGSVNECRLCHSAGAGVVLGFTTKQLDQMVAFDDGETVHQWQLLAGQGVLTRQPSRANDGAPMVNPHDPSADLDDRARSYLHTNCGVCHNRQGPATISFYAHRDYPFDELRITKRPGIGTFGMEAPQLVKPGDPYGSIILYRISKLGYGRMPYIGSQVVDSRGVALIESWIKSLSTDSQSRSSPAAHEANLLQLSSGSNDAARAQAIDDLLRTTEGSLALVAAMHGKRVTERDVQYVRGLTESMKGDIRGLFDHFLPESERRKTLGRNPDPNSVLQLTGDRSRGELIFVSDNARCRSCHDATDPNNSLGPTLAEIRDKFKQPGELLRQIIQPSLKVDEKFTSWTAVMSNGSVHSGLLVSRDEQQVILRTADKSILRLNRLGVEQLKPSDRSMMPDGSLHDLTPPEAADLLAYLLEGVGGKK